VRLLFIGGGKFEMRNSSKLSINRADRMPNPSINTILGDCVAKI
jgi:hypothetical protein